MKQRRTTDLNVAHDKKCNNNEKSPSSSREYARSTYCIQHVKLDTLNVSVWLHRAHGGMHHALSTHSIQVSHTYECISWWYDLSMMHFFAILRSLHSHSKASLLLWLLLWVCVCGRKKIRLMACVYVSLYVHAVLFIDRLVLWSQCMALFFNPYFSFVFSREREKKINQITYPCAVL